MSIKLTYKIPKACKISNRMFYIGFKLNTEYFLVALNILHFF